MEAQIAAADALEERGEHEEARRRFARLRQRRPADLAVLHGLARSELGLGNAERAVELFAELMEAEPRFRDYSAALDYAESLHVAGDTEEATGLLGGLVSETGRLNHRVALAHYLRLAGNVTAAERVLRETCRVFEALPSAERKRQQRWGERAEEMLDELQAAPPVQE